MALQTKEFIGSTGRPNLWTWKIIASEESADISTKTSVIKIESYIGRQSTAGGSYFMGTATLRYRAGGETRDIWYENWTTVNISAGGWHKIGEQTITVSNTGTTAEPTKITVSGELIGASFSPTTGSASGELTLTALHDSPSLVSVNITETNELLTNVGVENNNFVTNLSVKEFEINVETYDDATITKYEIINGDSIYDSTTNVVTMDLRQKNLAVRYDETTQRNIVDLYIQVTDNLGGVLKFAYSDTYVIFYTKPTIEKTSTMIKRKTGWSEQQQKNLVLTDNFGVLNFVGTCYKGNDAVGNNNEPTVQYKIWGNNESEPATYQTLTTPNVANVAINDFEIGNLLYTEPYNYKIRIYDVFFKEETTVTVKVDTLPTGVSVWSEYKDRVNFIKVTINNEQIFAPHELYESDLQSDEVEIFDEETDDSIENYKYIEIHSRISDGFDLPIIRVYEPLNKQFSIPCIRWDTGAFVCSANYSISDKKINLTSTTALYANSAGQIGYVRQNQDNYRFIITKVIGYK